jgi:hypothetical protein
MWSLVDRIHSEGVPHATIGQRQLVFAHLAILAATFLLASITAVGMVLAMNDLPRLGAPLLDWLTLLTTLAAVTVSLWDRTARFPLTAYYLLGFVALTLAQIARGGPPARFIWHGLAEWAGFLLVAAVVAWLLSRMQHVAASVRIPDDGRRWSNRWFIPTQAVLAIVTTVLAIWILLDFSFDEVGEGTALFGLVGRSCACPSALMLLGASIVMAWQATGAWRVGWQFGAIAAGVLFTSSISLARVDAASDTPWADRGVILMISTGMMSLMTGFGFGVGLPSQTDWIPRGRQAAPVLASISLSLLAVFLIRRFT